jgi:hypothetical protein
MNELDVFLQRCHQFPGARIKFHIFRGVFLASLTPRQQRGWPRQRILSALRDQFAVGRDAHGVLCVGGLSLDPPPSFTTEGGRLRLQAS